MGGLVGPVFAVIVHKAECFLADRNNDVSSEGRWDENGQELVQKYVWNEQLMLRLLLLRGRRLMI